MQHLFFPSFRRFYSLLFFHTPSLLLAGWPDAKHRKENGAALRPIYTSFFCDATPRCDGFATSQMQRKMSQIFAKPISQKLKYFEIFQLFRNAMRHKAVSPWRTQDVFLDTVQKRCRSTRTRSCTAFLSGQNPHKCAPYCVTKRTSQFSRNILLEEKEKKRSLREQPNQTKNEFNGVFLLIQ